MLCVGNERKCNLECESLFVDSDRKKNTSIFEVNNLKCMYTNAESLMSKLDELKVRIKEEKPDIIFVSETWIQDYDAKQCFSLNGYECNYFANPGEIRSGVCIYTHARFNVDAR